MRDRIQVTVIHLVDEHHDLVQFGDEGERLAQGSGQAGRGLIRQGVFASMDGW